MLTLADSLRSSVIHAAMDFFLTINLSLGRTGTFEFVELVVAGGDFFLKYLSGFENFKSLPTMSVLAMSITKNGMIMAMTVSMSDMS